MTAQRKVRKFMNEFCLTTFSLNFCEVCLALSFWFFGFCFFLSPLIFKLVSKRNILNLGRQFKSIFGTLPYIQDGSFCKNSERLLVWDYFCKKLHLRCFIRFWINKIHERALRIVYQDKQSNLKELLQKDKSVSIHMKNLQ